MFPIHTKKQAKLSSSGKKKKWEIAVAHLTLKKSTIASVNKRTKMMVAAVVARQRLRFRPLSPTMTTRIALTRPENDTARMKKRITIGIAVPVLHVILADLAVRAIKLQAIFFFCF